MELDDLLKNKSVDSLKAIELSTREQKMILHEALCEYSGKPGKEVELYIRFRTKQEIKQILNDPVIGKIYYRKKQEYLAPVTNDSDELTKLAAKVKDAEDWKIVATIEFYNNQQCDNCATSTISYTGTYQVLQHKNYYDRRRLIKLDEQIAAIYECKVLVADEKVSSCYSCRKSLDGSDIKKQFGSLFGLK